MIIIQDTKEKYPWDFTFFGLEQEKRGIPTGDYIIDGSKHFVFERKRTCGEISLNLGKKWKQFEAEMQRMQDEFVRPYIICEFPEEYIDIFPVNSGIPKNIWKTVRMSGAFIKKRLFESCDKYGIELLFFSNGIEAQQAVFEIIHEKFKFKRQK